MHLLLSLQYEPGLHSKQARGIGAFTATNTQQAAFCGPIKQLLDIAADTVLDGATRMLAMIIGESFIGQKILCCICGLGFCAGLLQGGFGQNCVLIAFDFR